jgi:hypothetical protein
MKKAFFRRREQFMLEKRGTPLFSKLHKEERVAYIKHNLHHMQDIFKLVKQEEATLKEDPLVAVALVEKLALGNSLGPMFYKDSKFLDLKTIAQPEYLTLLKIIKDTLPKLSFEDLNRTLYVLGSIHQRELGELTGELYRLVIEQSILSFSTKLFSLQDFKVTQSGSSSIQEIVNTAMYHMGIGLQGLLSLRVHQPINTSNLHRANPRDSSTKSSEHKRRFHSQPRPELH